MGFIIYRENENLRRRHISSFRQKKLVGKKMVHSTSGVYMGGGGNSHPPLKL